MTGLKFFEWQGLSLDGEHTRGRQAAESKTALEADLALRDVTLLKARRIRSRQTLRQRDVDFLLEQFAALLGARLDLAGVFALLRRQAPRNLQCAVEQMWRRVEAGESLAQSLEPHLQRADRFIAHVMRVGENSGRLVVLLKTLCAYRKHQQVVNRQVRKAFMYPATVLCTALGVSVLLLVNIVPQFALMYEGTENLPQYTRITLQMSDFIIRHFATMTSLVTLAFGIVMLLHKRLRRLRYAVSWLALKLPVIGALKKAYLQRLFAVLVGVAYQAGTPIDKAIGWFPQTTDNLVFAEKIELLQKYLAQGAGLGEAVKKTAIFGQFFEQMICLGESCGQLEESLQQISEYYGARIENSTAKLIQMIEPCLILLVAGIVGWIIASMYIPIFNLGTVL